jgi:uncharacterized membrane protein
MSRRPLPPANSEKSSAEHTPRTEVQLAVRADLERAIGPLLAGGQREIILERLTSLVVSEKFSGPIAHPKHLAEYERICPGAAERIIAMAEREQRSSMDIIAANIAIANKSQADDATDKRFGMQLGFAAFVIMMGCALTALYWGHPWMAGVFVATSVASAVGVFVQGRNGSKAVDQRDDG